MWDLIEGCYLTQKDDKKMSNYKPLSFAQIEASKNDPTFQYRSGYVAGIRKGIQMAEMEWDAGKMYKFLNLCKKWMGIWEPGQGRIMPPGFDSVFESKAAYEEFASTQKEIEE
jgi:hypothetical protein